MKIKFSAHCTKRNPSPILGRDCLCPYIGGVGAVCVGLALNRNKGVALAGASLGNLDVSGNSHAIGYELAKEAGCLLSGDANCYCKIGSSLRIGGECLGKGYEDGSISLCSLGRLVLSLLVSRIHLCDLVGCVLYKLCGKVLGVSDCGKEFSVSHIGPLSPTLGSGRS